MLSLHRVPALLDKKQKGPTMMPGLSIDKDGEITSSSWKYPWSGDLARTPTLLEPWTSSRFSSCDQAHIPKRPDPWTSSHGASAVREVRWTSWAAEQMPMRRKAWYL